MCRKEDGRTRRRKDKKIDGAEASAGKGSDEFGSASHLVGAMEMCFGLYVLPLPLSTGRRGVSGGGERERETDRQTDRDGPDQSIYTTKSWI